MVRSLIVPILCAGEEKNEFREDLLRHATRFHVEKALKTENDAMRHWKMAGTFFLRARLATDQRLKDAKNKTNLKKEEHE